MSPALNTLAPPTARQQRQPAPPRVVLPRLEAMQIPRTWPVPALACLGAGLFGYGTLPMVGAAGWAGVTLTAGVSGSLLTAVVGERRLRRRQLVHNVDTTLAPLTGVRGGVLARRWRGSTRSAVSGREGLVPDWTAWVGLPERIIVRYSPTVDDTAPDWASELVRALQRRLAMAYEVSSHNRRRCRLVLRVAREQSEETAAVPAAFARAERTVRELLGPTAKVEAEWSGEELQGLVVSHEAGVRVAVAGQRARIERTLSTMLPGRWRANWELESDRVRFAIRPTMPIRVPSRPYKVTRENLYELRLGVDEDGDLVVWRLRPGGQPHLLVVGATGAGKTVLIMGVVAQAALRGWRVRIVDPKRVEFKGMRPWPNVEIVATAIEDMVAVIHQTYLEMEERYRQIEEEDASEDDFEPMLLVLDEYRMLVAKITHWYNRIKKPGQKMPSKCPLLEELALLAAMGRTAGIHLVLGTQRPDAEFLTGEFRDNFRGRISLGPLSPEGAKMMWAATHIGVAIPRKVAGRGTAPNSDDVPVEVQTYWTPDPRRAHEPEDLALLEALRPPVVTHERLMVADPPTDLDGGETTYYDWVEAELVPWLEEQSSSRESGGRPERSKSGSGSSDRFAARRGPVEGVGEDVDDEEDLDDDGGVEDGEDSWEGFGPEVEVAVEQLEPGDLVLVDEQTGQWAVVEDAVADLCDEGSWCVDWRGDDDSRGAVSLPEGEMVTSRRPLELADVR